jgi:hypothetical protein
LEELERALLLCSLFDSWFGSFGTIAQLQ